jgi:hypothetical protein
MVDRRDVRRWLAIDAVLTALLGMVVAARPGVVTTPATWLDRFEPLQDATLTRLLGVGVAIFGVTKGLLYAVLLDRWA